MLPSDFEAFLEGISLVGAHDVAEIALVEVDVTVDISRRDQPTRGVDFFAAHRLNMSGNLGNAPIGDPNVPSAFLIHQPCILDDHVHFGISIFVEFLSVYANGPISERRTPLGRPRENA